jgi:DNA-binding NtrC family response regulator
MPQPAPARPAPPREALPIKPLRILLAEDGAMIGMLLAEIMISMGHHICAIETTEAGLIRGAARDQPDLLIVDEHLGTGSGVAAIAAICQVRPVRYILMSGGPVKHAAPGAIVLEKPFFEDDLLAAIARVMLVPAGVTVN